MYGTADRRAPAAQADAVYANLAGPKERHTFEGLDHESYLAKRREEWTGSVGWFLAGVKGRP
jgi:hypothetical protein